MPVNDDAPHAPRPNLSLLASARAWFRRPPRRELYTSHLEGVLGTSLEIQLSIERPDSGEVAEATILAEIQRLDALFSTYRASSELLQWLSTCGSETPVSPELAALLDAADRTRQVTLGAFDPAVHLSRDHSLPPSSFAVAAGRRRGDRSTLPPLWTVRPRSSGGAVATKLVEGPLDLDGIAKGFIGEIACLAGAEVPGVRDCLVNIGGDLRHVGESRISVGITDPRTGAENTPPVATICIRNQAVATSGGYRRGQSVDGERRSHILDPSTGAAATHILSASVVAPTATDADALATAFNVLDPQTSVELAGLLEGVGCLLVESNGAAHRSSYWTALETGDGSAN